MIICATGHRPKTLTPFKGGIDKYYRNTHPLLVNFCIEELRRIGPTKLISGMAAGFDMAIARAAITLRIPLICAIPFRGQYEGYAPDVRKDYLDILDRADKKFLISREFDHGCFQRRNIWMVDRAKKVVTLWNGTDGGTANCVKYARQRQIDIDDLWDRWQTYAYGPLDEFF